MLDADLSLTYLQMSPPDLCQAAGRNSVQFVGDVFRVGASSSSYTSALQQNEQEILSNADEAYARRLEAIRKQNKGSKN